MQVRDYVAAVDELGMATTRMRLRYPDEPAADPPLKHVMESIDIDAHDLNLRCEQTMFLAKLKKKLGQLFYLQNLEKVRFFSRLHLHFSFFFYICCFVMQTQSGCENGCNPELCPICQKQLGMQWAVLQCGHCFCMECIRVLIRDFSFGHHVATTGSLKCAICRDKTRHEDISYVVARPEKSEEFPEISIQVELL